MPPVALLARNMRLKTCSTYRGEITRARLVTLMARNTVEECAIASPRSLGFLSSTNDRAESAFTVGPFREMAIDYA